MWNVLGQERAVEQLKCALAARSLGHAYLLVGPAHVGKMALALALARAVNCESADAPCGVCPQCQRIAAGLHPDVAIVTVLSAEESEDGRTKTEIGVKQVEELQRSASLSPFEGKCKVFIIAPAERLSAAAANRLLKTLEEPEPRVLFILLAEAAGALPETVRSRCQCLDLGLVPAEVIEKTLLEGGLPMESVQVLSRICRGRPGWALAAAKDGSLLSERTERLKTLLSLMRGDYEERFNYAGELSARYGRYQEAVHEVLELWLAVWRDLLLLKLGCADAITGVDALDELTRLAAGFSLDEIKGAAGSVSLASEQLDKNANPRLVLEVLMLNLPRAEGAVVENG